MRRIELDHFTSYKTSSVFVPIVIGIIALCAIPPRFPFETLRTMIAVSLFIAAYRLLFWLRNRNLVILRSRKQVGFFNGTSPLARVNLDDVHSMHWSQAGFAYPRCKLLELRNEAGTPLIEFPIPIRHLFYLSSPEDRWSGLYMDLIDRWLEELREHVEGRETFAPLFERSKVELFSRKAQLVFEGVLAGGCLAIPTIYWLNFLSKSNLPFNLIVGLCTSLGILGMSVPFLEWRELYWYKSLKAMLSDWRDAGSKTDLQSGDYEVSRGGHITLALEEMPRSFGAIRIGMIGVIALFCLLSVSDLKRSLISLEGVLMLLIQGFCFWVSWAVHKLLLMLRDNAACTVVVEELGMIEFRPASGPPRRYSMSDVQVVWKRVGLVRLRNDAGTTYALISILEPVLHCKQEFSA